MSKDPPNTRPTPPPPAGRDDPDFKMRLYRQAIMALCKQNGGSLTIEGFMEITGEKGYLLNRALPGGGWEFKYVTDTGQVGRA